MGRPTFSGAGLVGMGTPGGLALLRMDLPVFWIKVTHRTEGEGDAPDQYRWTQVVRQTDGSWRETVTIGGPGFDPAYEANDETVTLNKVYRAIRDPNSGQVIFRVAGGGGGNVEIKSGDTRLLILGTYDEYKDCPGVPPKPPTTWSDGCQTERTETLCVPAYAYAVYVRCGYDWLKVGDTRDFGVWATETNGGTTSAFRRFHAPCWGGDRDPVTWLPDPDSDCMGVTFEPVNAGALTCSCPSWANDRCLIVTFRTIPRPCETGSCGYTDCADAINLFDEGDELGPYWDRQFSVVLNGNLCSISAQFGGGGSAGDVGIAYEDIPRTDCYWGPAVIDPCDPCAGFGRFRLEMTINAEERTNCGGSYHVLGLISIAEMRALLCDCEELTPSNIEVCQGCDGNVGLDPLVLIDTSTIRIQCCFDELDDAADDLPETVDDNGLGGITIEDTTP